MANIAILGGTGYTGGNIAAEAAARGHSVTSYSRTLPEQPVDGVDYRTGDLQDAATITRAVSGADVVVGALAPRGELEGKLRALYGRIADAAADAGARWGVVGGFSSLRAAEGAGRIAFSGEVPAQFLEEAQTLAYVADDLTASRADLDWFFVSPAATYGSYAPGEKLGHYRVGGEVALVADTGPSTISGVDYAAAFVDEIENPVHRRAQFGVAY
jgi:putative NADH-flavin reductase